MTSETLSLGGFDTCPIRNGVLFDESLGALPSKLHGFRGPEPRAFASDVSTTFGIVHDGEITLEAGGRAWGPLPRGFYFSVPGVFSVHGGGAAALFERIGFRGTFSVGGPVESRGRLTYIDGCSDSLLVFPPRAGDPCMNVLWFPERVRQTTHLHPTVRLALVTEGEGRCVTPDGEIPLTKGFVFRLREMSLHCFHTDGSRMSIVTYHPDSDWGPADANHPMINRTLIPTRT